jgi:hypothetical protein
VEADVFRRSPEHVWIVLELTQSAIAVEAEQSSDAAGLMVVVDVDRRRDPADRT